MQKKDNAQSSELFNLELRRWLLFWELSCCLAGLAESWEGEDPFNQIASHQLVRFSHHLEIRFANIDQKSNFEHAIGNVHVSAEGKHDETEEKII